MKVVTLYVGYLQMVNNTAKIFDAINSPAFGL